MGIIHTEQLSKYYGSFRGIIDLNLDVNEGEIHGFIGPNGAGKSTTIRTLLGLMSPSSGQASIFDFDCVKQNKDILKRVGYMPSEAMFYSSMKVSEVIRFSAKLFKQDCSAEAKKLCERFRVDTEKKIDELSLGNRRKVSIVCAMQHKPDLYIFDEPTSGLDPLMQKEFFKTLLEKNKEGATIFLSSHVLSEIQKYCTHATFIREGKLITTGTVEELMKTNAKRITVHIDDDNIREKFVKAAESNKGIYDLKNVEDHLSFLYRDDINRMVKLLSEYNLSELTITEPDLDEIFMHLYKGDD